MKGVILRQLTGKWEHLWQCDSKEPPVNRIHRATETGAGKEVRKQDGKATKGKRKTLKCYLGLTLPFSFLKNQLLLRKLFDGKWRLAWTPLLCSQITHVRRL